MLNMTKIDVLTHWRIWSLLTLSIIVISNDISICETLILGICYTLDAQRSLPYNLANLITVP